MEENIHHACHKGGTARCAKHRGPDSSRLHDPKLVCEQLNLKEGDIFADLGCGAGRYALAAAKLVGRHGRVYAVDLLEVCIGNLVRVASEDGLPQLQAVVADITVGLPLDSESCDTCFICTVLHSLNLHQCAEKLFTETRRSLKRGGRLFIIECKKTNTPFGPPISVRISPEELDELVCPYGFSKEGMKDLGYNYMIEYSRI